MFNHWVVPCNCYCCSFPGNMGRSTNPVAQLTLPSPIGVVRAHTHYDATQLEKMRENRVILVTAGS